MGGGGGKYPLPPFAIVNNNTNDPYPLVCMSILDPYAWSKNVSNDCFSIQFLTTPLPLLPISDYRVS